MAKKEKLFLENKSAWEKWNDKERKAAFAFAEEYKQFLTENKTEQESVESMVKILEAQGYKNIEKLKEAKNYPLKVYFNNRGACLAAFNLQKDYLKTGLNLILSHIDSPRIDVRQNSLREEFSLAFFKTVYYGGLKRYQWANIPLALHGRISTRAGKTVKVNIGEDEKDPIFMICDLLPHIRSSQNDRTMKDVFKGEELDVVSGSIPSSAKDDKVKEKVKAKVLELLHEKYGIMEQDLFTADLQFVPALKVRDMGFDKGLLAGYGHDDRICAYTSLKALLDSPKCRKSFGLYFMDKEEVGSIGATGAQSRFVENCVVRLLALTGSPKPSLDRVELMEKSSGLSADVGAAITPTFPDAFDTKGDPKLGFGIVVNKFVGGGGKSGSHEAGSAFTGRITRLLDKEGIPWQIGGFGKVDLAGGGTVARFIAQYNMDIIDIGPGVVSMHSPYEVISKADLYCCYLAYKAFINN
ncbi:MAG: aminopeptidase [Candidatus Wallbacteria bacterium]|nr:aminopeptidase [Candidatus Wallbacteria bacterium]